MKTNKLKQQKGTLLRVLQYVKPYRVLVIVSLLCACVSAAAQLLIPILTGKAIDQMIGAGQVNLSGVLVFAVWIAVVAALSAIAQQFLATSNNKIAYNISRDLRNAAFHKLQRLPLSYLDAHPSGDLVSRMIADVDTFSDGLLMGFTQLFTGVVLIVGTLTIMLIKNWMIALLVVVLTPLSMFVASFIARKTHHYFTEQARVRGQQTALINELIEGQKVVQSFGHEAASLSDFDCINDELGRVSLNATFFSSLTNPSTRLVNNIIYAAVALVGALSAVGGGISVGDLSVFLSYASQYAKPFNEISGVVTELQNALACAARVFSLLDEDDRVPDKENAAVLSPKGTVDLKDVCFRYVPDRPLIEGFNLHVKPGQRIAIVGPTGCGKTTTLRTITGFIEPVSGTVSVNEQDITHVPIEKRNIGIVFQSYALFPTMTVYDNIAFGLKLKKLKKPEIDQKVREIARKVDLSDEQLKKAVSQLSGGQQQRVAIARALVTGPSIICMDEPLSNLDAKLRVQLRNELKKMQREFGITTIYVTHDQEEALTLSDRIAVFNKGYIEQIGTPNEIYNHSKTEFVCNFIGDINRVEAPIAAKMKLAAGQNHFIRLERLHVNKPKRDDEILIDGVVENIEYYGLYIKYYIDVGSQILKAIEKNDGINIYAPGEKVTVAMKPTDVMSYDAQ